MTDHDSQQDGQPNEEYQGVSLLHLVNVLLRRRWMIVAGTLAMTVAVAGYSLTIEPSYTASATFLPSSPSRPSRTGSMDAMGSMVGVATSGDDLSENQSPEYYTALFKSRGFLNAILAREFFVESLGRKTDLLSTFALDANTSEERMQLAADELGKSLTIVAGKSKSAGLPIMTVTVVASEPRLAADIANECLAGLKRYNESTRTSKASSNRSFVEVQLDKARQLLVAAEAALTAFSTSNRKLATPAVQTEKERLLREIKTREEVFISLAKELEFSKIQEEAARQTIEILEPAVAPIARTSPARTRMVTLAATAGLILFSLLALGIEYLRNLNRDEEDVREFFENISGVTRDLTLGRFGARNNSEAVR